MKRYKDTSGSKDSGNSGDGNEYSDKFDEIEEDGDEGIDKEELNELNELEIPEDAIINAEFVIKEAHNYPLCEFFLETRKNVKTKSALAWLGICDNDTVSMIVEISDKMKGSNEITEAQSNEKAEDIFDSIDEEKEKEEIDKDSEITDESDFCGLAILLYCWENTILTFPAMLMEELEFQLSVYANAEQMRREGLVKIKGNGLMRNVSTKYSFTKKGESSAMAILSKMGIIDEYKAELKSLKKDKSPKKKPKK